MYFFYDIRIGIITFCGHSIVSKYISQFRITLLQVHFGSILGDLVCDLCSNELSAYRDHMGDHVFF